MLHKVYRANYVDSLMSDETIHNNIFVAKNLTSKPSMNFVMTRTQEGKPLSRYGDAVWDFRAYQPQGDTSSARMHFSKYNNEIKSEIKWLLFILLYFVDSGKSTCLSVSTIMGYKKVVCLLSDHALKNGQNIYSILETEKLLIKFVSTLKTRSQLSGTAALLNNLLAIPRELSGYKVFRLRNDEIAKIISKSTVPDKQHPVIPPRLFEILINQINGVIDTVSVNQESLLSFIKELLRDEYIGRCRTKQYCSGKLKNTFPPNFIETAEIYGLSNLFNQFGVRNIPSFVSFITKVQHGCRTLLQIYSGMRVAEVLSLKVNSLNKNNSIGGISYKLVGRTTKLVGQPKQVSWITSVDILNAFDFSQTLAKLVGEFIGLLEEDTPLFISTSYLSLYQNFDYDGIKVRVSIANSKSREIYTLFKNDLFIIESQDLDHLDKINPFRAWESEKAFKVGATWRFTTHQFRRSLAFYVAQSSLVSLPSLKRQFKHIGREMTLYYCKSMAIPEEFDNTEHISRLIKKVKPYADATAYLHDILLSSDKLFGAHGKFVEANTKLNNKEVVLEETRDNLVKQFKDGYIAYEETSLGACTSIEPCEKKLFRVISACLGCKSAVIKPRKLDRVIKSQEIFVEKLKLDKSYSIEYRTELSELEDLKHYKERVVDGNKK